jgi:hypothetical protein
VRVDQHTKIEVGEIVRVDRQEHLLAGYEILVGAYEYPFIPGSIVTIPLSPGESVSTFVTIAQLRAGRGFVRLPTWWPCNSSSRFGGGTWRVRFGNDLSLPFTMIRLKIRTRWAHISASLACWLSCCHARDSRCT